MTVQWVDFDSTMTSFGSIRTTGFNSGGVGFDSIDAVFGTMETGFDTT